jgi:ribosomal protein S18
MEKIKGTRLGGLVTNETVVALAAGAYAFTKFMGLGALKSNVSRWGTFGLGLAAAGGLAGYNESLRVKRERAQHIRERAKGMTFEDDAKKRAEMEQNTYETRSAADISSALESRLERARAGELSQEELAATLDQLADLEARVSLGDERKADLISYTRFDQVEQERAALLLSRARMKAALRGNDRAAFEAQLAELTQGRRDELTGGEEGMDQKDRIFAKMRRKKIAGAVTRTVLIGGAIGLSVQEVAAAFDENRDGLIEGIWRSEGAPAQEATAFEGVRHLFSGSSPRMPFENPHTVMIGSTSVELPEGANLIANPDGTYDLLRGSDVIADNVRLELDAQGNLTEASRQLLGGEDVAATHSLTEGQTVSSTEYVNQHEDLTHQIRRDLWYNNDTKAFDQNELRTQWGGQNNTGIDSNGNYVFTVDPMTPGGSFHADQSIDAPAQTRAGNLKMLFSLSGDTQNRVFEVPIDANGNAVIPRDSEIGRLMFREEGGRAVFTGRFAEVAQSVGMAEDGAEQVRILGTHVGAGQSAIETPPVSHVRLDVPAAASDLIPPPFLPFVPRTPLERGIYGPKTPKGAPILSPVQFNYYYGGPMTEEQREAYRRQRSPALRENPDARLDPRKEIDGYLSRQEKPHLQQAQALAYSVEPMKPSCELSICIPVAGHQEEENIERTLSSYLNQSADPDTFELMLFVNQPDSDNEGRTVAPDRTMARILEFKRSHPELNIRIMHAVLPRENARIGYIRKLLTDANLVRMRERGGTQDTVIVSNDADTKGVAPEYTSNFLEKLEQDGSTDALMGQLDWDPEAYIRNPLVHIGTRLFQYIDMQNRRSGMNIASSGANFAFKASTYAAIGGYDSESRLAEDVDLGRRIKAARTGARSHTPIAYGGAKVSRLYTSSRRAERAVRDGLSPVEQWNQGFSAFDDEVRKTRWEDTGEPIDYDNPVVLSRLVTELETVINRTLAAASNWQDRESFTENVRRSLGWLGIKFEPAGETGIRITDASRLIAGLEKYQKEGMRIMARKTAKPAEAPEKKRRRRPARKAASR